MNPRIKTLPKKRLVGLQIQMSLTDNQTAQLWGRFGPRIKEITNRVTQDKISMQVYGTDYHKNFNPKSSFDKWAAVEVSDFESIPQGLQPFTLAGGLYAVFQYKGSSADTAIFQYIFWDWLPNSPYSIDNRPHFEVLGEKYKNNDPTSEEEIWIPIKLKQL